MSISEQKIRLSILLVDDEPPLIELMAYYFEEAGCVVHAAGNVRDAIKLLEANSFDAIVTDERMPGGSGFELLKYARVNSAILPVFMVSGFVSTEDLKGKGATGFFSKPFNMDVIVKAVLEAAKTFVSLKTSAG